jgi:sigma-E factor negative regulatory protein RseB
MSKTALFSLCLLFCSSAATAAEDVETAQESPSPHVWLERMNEALANRNYDGTFFHLRNGKVETLRIIHRVEDGRATERLVCLDGNGREVLRNEDEVTCFLPDQRRVLVESRHDSGPLLGSLPQFGPGLFDYYELKLLAPERVINRNTEVIAVVPKDGYRYGYTLWLDQETAMPLKTQLCDAKGAVIEQILFASLALPERIEKSAVQPQVNSEGFQWVRQRRPRKPPAEIEQAWRAVKVPPGFKLTASSKHVVEGSKQQMAHLVYSDGLASVSVFIEVQGPDKERLKGLSRVGSAFAFSTTIKGHQVTAMGEVPVDTVRLIAHSIQPTVESDSVASQ